MALSLWDSQRVHHLDRALHRCVANARTGSTLTRWTTWARTIILPSPLLPVSVQKSELRPPPLQQENAAHSIECVRTSLLDTWSTSIRVCITRTGARKWKIVSILSSVISSMNMRSLQSSEQKKLAYSIKTVLMPPCIRNSMLTHLLIAYKKEIWKATVCRRCIFMMKRIARRATISVVSELTSIKNMLY